MKKLNNKQVKQLKRMALEVALRFHLSSYDTTKTPSQVLNSLGKAIVWEPFEYWENDDVADSIDSLSYDVERTVRQALQLAGVDTTGLV